MLSHRTEEDDAYRAHNSYRLPTPYKHPAEKNMDVSQRSGVQRRRLQECQVIMLVLANSVPVLLL